MRVAALVLVGLSACTMGTYDSPGDIPFHPGESHFGLGLGTSGVGSMYAKGAVAAALNRIRTSRAGRSELPLATVNLYDTYLVATVQGMGDPADRDTYRVDIDGSVKVTPVRGGSKDKGEIFDAADVAWDQIPAMVSQAVTALHLDHGVVSGVSVRKNWLGKRDLNVTVSCTSARHTGNVVFDAQGKQLSATTS